MKWVTRIPTHFNDGSQIPPELITEILRRVTKLFNGASLDGPGCGAWIGSDGTVYDETSFVLSVACLPDALNDAREVFRWIGQQLDQEAMYFEIQDSPVEIIAIRSKDSTS